MSDMTTQPKSQIRSCGFNSVREEYKRTDVGVIPADWDCDRLGNLATRVGSGITPTGGERVYVTEGRPFLRSQNVGWGVLNLDDLAFITDEIHASFAGSQINEGDVLLNITGASIGRSAVADTNVARGNVNQHVCEIRPDPKRLDSHFLNGYLLSAVGQKQIDSFQAGGNRQGLNYSQIRSFLVPCPTVREQHAIAEALSDVDGLLAALEKLIDKKRSIKQAAMQQLLTGETRLPGFSGAWQLKRLGDIGPFSKGRGIKREDVSLEGLPCVRYGELYTRYHNYIVRIESRIPPIVALTALPIQTGTLLFAGSGETAEEIGRCAAYLGKEQAYAGGDIIVLTPLEQDSIYLGHLMNHPTVVTQRARMAQGNAVVHISASNLAQVKIELPSITEQTAIAAVLSDMDKEITALEERRDKARAIKQGMMQALLTGHVRLVEPEPASEQEARTFVPDREGVEA